MTDADRLRLVGRVTGAFGVRGEARLAAYTEDPMALLGWRDLKRADGSPALTLLAARPVKDGLVVKASGITTKEEADALKGLRLYVPRARLPPPDEDDFYVADLIGLEARSVGGEALGRIKGVQDYGAGDILEIDPGDGAPTWLVPFTKEAAPEVNIAEGFVVVVRPEEVE
ncbi:MAG: ribosome maturation factor RimM [Caulobacteraceae bacterium]